MKCKIELLNPQLLDDHAVLLKEIDELKTNLGLDIGWHYPLDLIWILKQLEMSQEGTKILDAGAGKGLLQFAMAEKGFHVVSVDFSKRLFQLPIRLSYPIQTLTGDLSTGEYLDHMKSIYSGEHPIIKRRLISLKRLAYKVRRFLVAMVRLPLFSIKRKKQKVRVGSILIYQSNILSMPHIEDSSIDVVVSLSVIEHMKKTEIENAIKEFQRVLKRGGVMIITTSAAKDCDWYHEPSMGWCFSEQSIRDLFGLNQTCPSNWDDYVNIQEKIRSSVELQRRLSPSYAWSGKKGMPWGVWNPQYIPVGIFMRIPQA
jgi:ubiquinone/menaquinone biosynthesis C-methylase UbiE